MARKSKVVNPSAMNVRSGDSLSVADCVRRWASATGMKQEEARNDLVFTGFTRNLALFTYAQGKGAPAPKGKGKGKGKR